MCAATQRLALAFNLWELSKVFSFWKPDTGSSPLTRFLETDKTVLIEEFFSTKPV
jgi:hypothetical protein